MPLNHIETELQALAKFKAKQLSLLTNGVKIQRVCGAEISDLILEAGSARFRLAAQFLETAKRLVRMRPPSFRSSISRSYYSIYHAARAVAYVHHAGDDYEAHNELHKGIPDVFPDAEQWKNAIKECRLRRNDADYDPYPVPEADFQAASAAQLQTADDFLKEAQVYLAAKGCKL